MSLASRSLPEQADIPHQAVEHFSDVGDEHRSNERQAVCIRDEAGPEVSRLAVGPSKVFGVFNRVPDGSPDTTRNQQNSLEERERIVFIARRTCRPDVDHRRGDLEISRAQRSSFREGVVDVLDRVFGGVEVRPNRHSEPR